MDMSSLSFGSFSFMGSKVTCRLYPLVLFLSWAPRNQKCEPLLIPPPKKNPPTTQSLYEFSRLMKVKVSNFHRQSHLLKLYSMIDKTNFNLAFAVVSILWKYSNLKFPKMLDLVTQRFYTSMSLKNH